MEQVQSIPVLLLKTKSTPHDGYEEYFSHPENGQYQPIFVPVLEHQFQPEALQRIRYLVEYGHDKTRVSPVPNGRLEYGGIIVTSQRAVEAFSHVVNEVRRDHGPSDSSHPTRNLLSADVPIYVVGPATARGMRALDLPCPVVGEESGNGDALAAFVLQHYNEWSSERRQGKEKLPLLFLAGEQRRDIIPRTVQAESLGENRIVVDELPCYTTTEMASFRCNFSSIYNSNIERGADKQWVVVFSPTGCKAMLASLGFLDEKEGKAKAKRERLRHAYIATIGPTTRDFLQREFGFEPDVCAPKPSPEGVGGAIREFMETAADI